MSPSFLFLGGKLYYQSFFFIFTEINHCLVGARQQTLALKLSFNHHS